MVTLFLKGFFKNFLQKIGVHLNFVNTKQMKAIHERNIEIIFYRTTWLVSTKLNMKCRCMKFLMYETQTGE